MFKAILLAGVFVAFSALTSSAQTSYEVDVIQTSAGDLEITFIGHGSLMFRFGGKVIYVDPDGRLADFSRMPKADLIMLTHEHRDHLDPEALNVLRTAATELILTESCTETVKGGRVMRNGDAAEALGLPVKAVPAYNIVNMRQEGVPFHPKGRGNGYIITFGDKLVYVAGDTENTPEMKALTGVDIAFLPMNLPYTMTPEMVAEAARAFKPKILYPYHYGDTDVSQLLELMKDAPDTEVRVRRMK